MVDSVLEVDNYLRQISGEPAGCLAGLRRGFSHESQFFVFDSMGVPVEGVLSGDYEVWVGKGGAYPTVSRIMAREIGEGWYTLSLTADKTDKPGLLTVLFLVDGKIAAGLQWMVQAD